MEAKVNEHAQVVLGQPIKIRGILDVRNGVKINFHNIPTSLFMEEESMRISFETNGRKMSALFSVISEKDICYMPKIRPGTLGGFVPSECIVVFESQVNIGKLHFVVEECV